MSSFSCGECGADILDTEQGYVTECQHYPIENRTDRPCPRCGAQIFDPLGRGVLVHDVNTCRGEARPLKGKQMEIEKKQTILEADAIVMKDIKKHMMALVEAEPIVNTGSFAMTLLWQIFEAASEEFEEWRALDKLSDYEIAAALKSLFPVFVAEYPRVMKLDS